LQISRLQEEVRARRERASTRWAGLAHEKPELGRALDLQQRLIGRQLDLLGALGPSISSMPRSAVVNLLNVALM